MRPEPVTASANPFYSRTDRVWTTYRHAIGLLLLAVSGCSPLATPRESSGRPMCLPGPGTSTRSLTIFWRSSTWIAVPQPTGRSSARCRRRAGAARTTSNTRCPRAAFGNSFETGHTFVFDLSDPVHRVCSVTSAMRPYSHPHSFAARRAVLCSPPIKVSRPITAQLAGWLNWTTVGECSEPRAQQILSIGICDHTV